MPPLTMSKLCAGILVLVAVACALPMGQGSRALGFSDQVGGAVPVNSARPMVRPVGAGGAAGLPPGAIRVQKAAIVDSSGFEQPMTAISLLIPAGWQTQGGVNWQQNMAGCGRRTPHLAWTARSPDGYSAIEIIPGENWNGTNSPVAATAQQGCPNVWISSAREYIQTWVHYNRPGATILDYLERADFVAEVEKQIQQQREMQQRYATPGMEMRQWAEGGQALLSYQQQGREMREIIGMSVTFSLLRMEGVMPGEIVENLSLASAPGYAVRAPAGQLDLNVAEMLRKSPRPNPQWVAKMAQHNNKIAQINLKGARDRSRLIAQHGEEMRKIQRESWDSYNASRDCLHRETTETIRGTETYNDPYYGGTVELDNTYEHAWQLNDGTYVLTHDPSFEPYRYLGQEGRRLEITP